MDIKDKEKKEYEIGVLVKNETDLPGIIAMIREHKGEVTADFRAKKIKLEYPIKKETEAIFAYANFEADGETAKSLEKTLLITPQVLRSLIVVAQKVEVKQPAERPLDEKRASAPRASGGATASSESRSQHAWPLSNEALEKKIEEILK